MEAQEPTQETAPEVTAAVTEAEPTMTAKQMAEAEEINATRLRALTEQRQLPPEPEPVPIIQLAAQGMDALHEALRQHSNREPPVYVPPPRTNRQMTALEEELEAGRKRVEANEAHSQMAAEMRAKAAAEERAKEGFTTPVHRPGDTVPNPMGGMGAYSREV